MSVIIKQIRYQLLWLSLFLLSVMELSAQSAEMAYAKSRSEVDTNYVKTFPNHITSRIYLSRKYTNLRLEEEEESTLLEYEPNTTVNLGVGATVNGFTLNLAYGFKFMNPENNRGETEYLDLQSHMYGRKYAADFFGQFYQGMYLENSSFFFPNSTEFYLRPDMTVALLGGSYLRVFNHRKFSYAASMVQNEFQKKSAGSFLLGGKVIIIGAQSDSSLIPTYSGDSIFNSFKGLNEMASFQLGPSVGYAHTFVMWHHFFFTLSFDLGLLIGPVSYTLENGEKIDEWQLNPSADFRFALGYNSKKTYWGISFVQDDNQIRSSDKNSYASFGIGNARFNYVRRFRMGPKLQSAVDKLPF